MKWLSFLSRSAPRKNPALLAQFMSLKTKVDSLPPLAPAAKAEFDHGVDLEHLYYSSKIEGTNLSEKEIKRAVHEKAA